MARELQPRPLLTMRASYVSQENSLAILAITARKFREVIVPRCKRVTRIGKTVLVELDEAERVIRSLAVDNDGADDGTAHKNDAPAQPRKVPQSAREIIEELGFEMPVERVP